MARHMSKRASGGAHCATRPAAGRFGTVLAFTCAVLLCLTLLSLHAVAGTYAKYTVSGASTDSARVAKFGTVSIEGGDALAITGSAAMGDVTSVQVTSDSANGIALFSADASGSSSYTAQPVKVKMTATEVAARVLLTIKGAGWKYGTNGAGDDVVYLGSYSTSVQWVWFEPGDDWKLVSADNDKGIFVFSTVVEAGDSLDASVMKNDRLYSSLTVEARSALSETAGTADLRFSAQAIQID